jgi:hypothetical protein
MAHSIPVKNATLILIVMLSVTFFTAMLSVVMMNVVLPDVVAPLTGLLKAR